VNPRLARSTATRTFASSRAPRLPARLLRALYVLRALYRWLRVQRPLTAVLGPQYRRSRDRIEIDITYRCNLRCLNCNRSCRQAPESLDISEDRIRDFVQASLDRRLAWRSIRVLGGEPTLHPRFHEIIAELRRYTAQVPSCSLEVCTNGHGPFVAAQLARLPEDVYVESSSKEGDLQPDFRPFNLAPRDDLRYAAADFRNGCSIMESCGMGLGPGGYFPCALAAGIDRVAGDGAGRATLPHPEDSMEDLAARFCAVCGRFRDGHYVPKPLRRPLTGEPISRSWKDFYAAWRARHGR